MIAVSTTTTPVLRSISATRSSARRCLFGRLDHKKINESLERELRNLDEELEKKWDFDFVKERPLPGGRYAWSAVDKKEYVPGPYTREYPAKPTRPRTQGTLKRRLNFDEEDKEQQLAVVSTPVPEREEAGCLSSPAPEVNEETAVNTCPDGPPAAANTNNTNSNTTNTKSPLRVQSHMTSFFQQRKRQRLDKC